jgi:NADH dehydrogenase
VFIDLIEAHEHPLSEMSKQTRKRAIKHLERLGIKVLTKTRISGIENSRLRTSEGKLLSPGHFIWTGGVRANPLAETLPVQQGRGGRLKVSPFLNLSSNPEVYCIGDIAETSYRTTAAPPNAPGAIQMGKAAALNIARSLQGLPLKPFKYRNEGELLYLGHNNAVIHIGKLVFDGFIAWLLWHAFYLIELKGLENRTKAAIDWVVEYGSQRRLITQLSFKPMG